MVFAPKGAKGLSPGFRVCLAPATWPEGPAPKGQQSLAQGLPWVGGNKRFALKGLEVWSCFPGRYLMAPSGLIRVGEITQGKPWAKLFWPLRATDWAASGLWTGAKHVQGFNPGKHPNKWFALKGRVMRTGLTCVVANV